MARQTKYLTTQAKGDPLELVHGAIGYHYRLSNIQAALGVAQLERLDEYMAPSVGSPKRTAKRCAMCPASC